MSTYKYLHTNQKKIFTETNICKKKEMVNILGSEIRLYFLDFPDNNICSDKNRWCRSIRLY